MNVLNVPPQPAPEPPSSKLPLIAIIAAGTLLACGNIYLLSKTSHLERQLSEMRTAVKTEITTLQNDSLALNAQNARAFAEIRTQLEETGLKSAKATTEAAAAARRYSEQMTKKLAEQQEHLQEQQMQSAQQLNAQLGEMRQFADETTHKMSGIVTDVSTVRTEVANAKTEIDRTIADLHSVRGDLGVQSGLIATNARELAALRTLGEREYFEFQLMSKSKQPTRVGEISLSLKKADPKRNKFTLELLVDDKRIEKKDRTINEPVQFYMTRARMPYEIVINEVRNDRIVGYLATPKVKSIATAVLR